MTSKSENTIINLIWRCAERFGAEIVTFIVSIVLARILEPTVYGSVALVNVFIIILNVFVDSGLGNALIQKKDADDLDFSTVFYANIVFCSILYLILFFAAPFVAHFYNDNIFTPVIRVLGVTILISGLKNIQQAYVSRNLLFKNFFFSTIGGTIASGVVGIIMAYMGFGIWALVAQHLTNTFVDTVILWITVRWRPKKLFSFKRFKGLFSFGWKLLCSTLLTTIYDNIRSLIIGKKYTSENLAFYNKGQQFPSLAVNNVNTALDSVLFPIMSKEQDNVENVKRLLKKSIVTGTYIIAPLMTGLFVCAKPFISLIFTDKWLPCVPFLRIFCITMTFMPIHTGNLNAIKAIGRSDLILKQEFFKKIVGLSLLLISMWFGVMAIAYSALLSSILNQLINTWPNKKLLNYSYLEQLKDIIINLLLSAVMGAIVYCVTFFGFSPIITLLIQATVGVAFYVGVSIITKNPSFNYVLNLTKNLLSGMFGKISNKKGQA